MESSENKHIILQCKWLKWAETIFSWILLQILLHLTLEMDFYIEVGYTVKSKSKPITEQEIYSQYSMMMDKHGNWFEMVVRTFRIVIFLLSSVSSEFFMGCEGSIWDVGIGLWEVVGGDVCCQLLVWEEWEIWRLKVFSVAAAELSPFILNFKIWASLVEQRKTGKKFFFFFWLFK